MGFGWGKVPIGNLPGSSATASLPEFPFLAGHPFVLFCLIRHLVSASAGVWVPVGRLVHAPSLGLGVVQTLHLLLCFLYFPCNCCIP